MHIEFLLEEPSSEAALSNLLPKLLQKEDSWKFITFNGKSDLLDSLEKTLRGYSKWIDESIRIVVLLDRDSQNCIALKQDIEAKAIKSGLTTKSSSPTTFQLVNRIAIEELESWFLGDANALRTAYPKVKYFENKAKYRNPDEINGGTWEALEKLLQNVGYYPSGLPKVEVARNISKHMNPNSNRSRSFNAFKDGILACI